MKLAIMQPYLFPYIGYFQLIQAVDKFVIYDDVQYMKGGWINRNKILVNKNPYTFTFSVKKDSYEKNINQRYFNQNFSKERKKFLKTLKESYGKATYFNDVFPLVEKSLQINIEEQNIAEVISKSIKLISEYLRIDTEFILSSNVEKKTEAREERIIELNKILGCNHYINAIGGKDLYTKEYFADRNVKLNFIKTDSDLSYEQDNDEFVPNLSIIDVLMYNSVEETRELLNKYQLI
ncbi:WbqC family protein [Gracilibacillus saliphilus]|uniref:WbqC family protein n=1 Tax=Gracilibacillus saliphilus TaxID=543890 RepID=UPI0013D626F9|nr:WbqC family protein [Gracilibacillus saliphilus]